MLGSRYVEGGGVENWGAGRRFVSSGGSLYARVLLGVGVRDLTGGFKCYRRAVLEAIDLTSSVDGYAFQIETTYRALRAGFRVVEMPITFADREAGSSKMSKSIFLEAVWKVPALRPERSPDGYKSAMDEVTDETFQHEVLDAASRSSSTSGRRGAGRAGPSSRSSRRSPPSTRAASAS